MSVLEVLQYLWDYKSREGDGGLEDLGEENFKDADLLKTVALSSAVGYAILLNPRLIRKDEFFRTRSVMQVSRDCFTNKKTH